MAFRDEWCADLAGWGLSSSSGEYTVQIKGRLRMPERQAGRMIYLPLDPEMADRLGNGLKEYAKKARELNE